MSGQSPFPLFKGATRVATVAGVPMMALLIMLMIVASLAMLLRSLWWWAAAIPLWVMMAAITRHDDKAFRIIWLWIDTKVRNRNKRFWESSSYSPRGYRR